MKALLYKEFKLAMHPMCYVFVFAFPIMILIPSFPISVGFIYILSCYPVLFLGANKGQQSNDLLYSTLLPVRKKDIVLARMFTVAFMQLAFILTMSALLPLAIWSHSFAPSAGIPLTGYVSTLAIAIIGYAIADLIFFPIYYKQGKSIVASTLLTILGFALYLMTFTVVLIYIPGLEGYKNFLTGNLLIQFGLLLGSLIIYFLIHIAVYKISARRLEKVDF